MRVRFVHTGCHVPCDARAYARVMYVYAGDVSMQGRAHAQVSKKGRRLGDLFIFFLGPEGKPRGVFTRRGVCQHVPAGFL